MISVIIPIFNRYELVKQMIDSITVQSYSNWELILVDDGSREEIIEKLKKYISGNSKINYIQRMKGKKGAPSCRNIGFKRAKGEYVVFFDSDDLVTPDCLENRVKYMDQHPNLDAAVFPARHFKCNCDEKNGLLNGIRIYSDDLAAFYSSSLPYIVWNVIFKRKALISKNIVWDEELLSLQDADYNIQCILKGLYIEYAEGANIDYYARTSETNTVSSSIFKPSRFDSHIYFVNKQFSNLSIQQLNRYKKSLYFRLIYTYLLFSYNYSQYHVEELLNIAKKYNCMFNLLKMQIIFNKFLFMKLRLPHNISNAITFLPFLIKKKYESIIRNNYELNHR